MHLSISMPGLQEWVLIGVVAVLVFGRKLPEVIAEVLSVVRQVRRHIDDLRRSTGFDQDLREAQRALDDARATVRREARVLTAPAPRIQSANEAVRRGVKNLEDEIRQATPPATGVGGASAPAASAPASNPDAPPPSTARPDAAPDQAS
jgi:Sec-independent protein translocase protein TatA